MALGTGLPQQQTEQLRVAVGCCDLETLGKQSLSSVELG